MVHLRHLLPGRGVGGGAGAGGGAVQCDPRSGEPLRAVAPWQRKDGPRGLVPACMNMNSERAQRRKKRRTTWVIPLTYVLTTLIVGMLLPRIEHYVLPHLVTTMSASAAMGLCGAVASGMISLTGIVFSLAFVMVQFSATAYSPRLVLWVARDPVVSHAMG